MRAVVGAICLSVAVFLSFPAQEMIPPIASFYGARILFVPLLVCYAGLALPLPAMLPVAALAGFLSDLAYLHVAGGQVEIGLGWSIVYFVILGVFAHGFQPAFQRGHWWLHMPLSMLGTSLFLALQFAMISFRREGFAFGEVTLWRILGPGLLAGVMAPVVGLVAWQAGQWWGDERPRNRRGALSRS